jgi:hypothetical protein
MAKTYLKILQKHYDRWLGTPAGSWTDEQTGLSVALFENVPEPGLATFATVGLGAHELSLSNRTLRQELLTICRGQYAFWPMHAHLIAAATLALDSHRAFLRGDAIDVGEVHAEEPRCHLRGFAFTDPVRFSDDFMVLHETEPPLMIVEMLPVTRFEHRQIGAHGIDWLLDRLSEGRIDELDYCRASEEIH